jgi:hypothetical protein
MKLKTLLFVMTSLAVIMFPGCKGREIQSQWAVQAINADGASSDWKDVPLLYSDELDGWFAVRNDAEYCYLLLKFRDSKLITTMSHAGLKLWFDPDHKEVKDHGFIYRSPELAKYVRNTTPSPQMPSGDHPGSPRDFAAFNAWDLVLLDRANDKDDYTHLNGSNILEASFGRENDVFLYEFCVPLALGPKHTWALGTHAGEAFEVGIQVGGMDRRPGGGGPGGPGRGLGTPGGGKGPSGGEGPEGPGGMGGMGGSSHKGSRHGGGPGGSSRDQRIEIWLNVKLAEAPGDSIL